jgi:hypothetical protein
MRPKVVVTPKLLFFPVRRSCSSAIQMALGQDFRHWYDTTELPGQRFTCYRNTFDRLRSLYHNFVYPAPQGLNTFDLGFEAISYMPNEYSFNAWLELVAATQDETCNEHLHSQDWHTVIAELSVYDFENRQVIFEQVLNKQIEQLGPPSPDLSYLRFSPSALEAIRKRYASEIETFGYHP